MNTPARPWFLKLGSFLASLRRRLRRGPPRGPLRLERLEDRLPLSASPFDDFGDTPAAAAPLAVAPSGDAVQRGAIEVTGDVDFFRFVAPVTDLVTARQGADQPGRLRPLLAVFGASQQLLALGAEGGIVSAVDFPVIAGQTYFLRAAALGPGTGGYTLTLSPFGFSPDLILAASGVAGPGPRPGSAPSALPPDPPVTGPGMSLSIRARGAELGRSGSILGAFAGGDSGLEAYVTDVGSDLAALNPLLPDEGIGLSVLGAGLIVLDAGQGLFPAEDSVSQFRLTVPAVAPMLPAVSLPWKGEAVTPPVLALFSGEADGLRTFQDGPGLKEGQLWVTNVVGLDDVAARRDPRLTEALVKGDEANAFRGTLASIDRVFQSSHVPQTDAAQVPLSADVGEVMARERFGHAWSVRPLGPIDPGFRERSRLFWERVGPWGPATAEGLLAQSGALAAVAVECLAETHRPVGVTLRALGVGPLAGPDLPIGQTLEEVGAALMDAGRSVMEGKGSRRSEPPPEGATRSPGPGDCDPVALSPRDDPAQRVAVPEPLLVAAIVVAGVYFRPRNEVREDVPLQSRSACCPRG